MQFVIINLRQFRQRQRARRSRGGGTITTDAAKLHKSLPTSGREKRRNYCIFQYISKLTLSLGAQNFSLFFSILLLSWFFGGKVSVSQPPTKLGHSTDWWSYEKVVNAPSKLQPKSKSLQKPG